MAEEDCGLCMFLDFLTASIKRLSAVDWLSFFTQARLHSMSKRSPLLVTLKAGVIYTQCVLVHTRVCVLYRVRILYPVRNAYSYVVH